MFRRGLDAGKWCLLGRAKKGHGDLEQVVYVRQSSKM